MAFGSSSGTPDFTAEVIDAEVIDSEVVDEPAFKLLLQRAGRSIARPAWSHGNVLDPPRRRRRG